jgi:hypothetical protein
MTTPPSFPSLPGVGFPVRKKRVFSTEVAKHVSGRQVRKANYAYPLYQFELVVEGLDQNSVWAALSNASYQALMGLYLQVQGQFGTFLYTDPDDYSVTAQSEGTGDGSTTSFTLYRTFGGFVDPVGWVTSLENVYLNGVLQSSSTYSLTEPNTLVFDTAPGAGVAITVDMQFAFNCRFLADDQEFEEFMSGLYSVSSLKFESVKP